MKNLLKIIGVVLALRFVFRLLRGGRRRFAGGFRPGRMARFGSGFETRPDGPVAIDNQWFRPTVASAAPHRTVAVA
ncbi:MAG: hypothetical protein M3Y54_03030 [Bacteroidota bacterium]|nr:hypothetical protein [Bacteroidota bacterium]